MARAPSVGECYGCFTPAGSDLAKIDGLNWDFWTQLPEALHQVTIIMSERGIPKSFRHQHGFGSHTYSLINANNRIWVKFHFRTRQGIQNLSDADADALVGKDRESHQRDLFTSIEGRDFPRWTVFIQVMTDEQAKAFPFNPFDLTKVWPKADYPLIEVGYFELNRNPENFFTEVEQAAFTPANVVPGIGFSPDKMLQARLFSYGDAQRYRLGVNHHQIPVNVPKCPFHSYHRAAPCEPTEILAPRRAIGRTASASGRTSRG